MRVQVSVGNAEISYDDWIAFERKVNIKKYTMCSRLRDLARQAERLPYGQVRLRKHHTVVFSPLKMTR